jgi:YidC/Oxa1 family membrane protein insertase
MIGMLAVVVMLVLWFQFMPKPPMAPQQPVDGTQPPTQTDGGIAEPAYDPTDLAGVKRPRADAKAWAPLPEPALQNDVADEVILEDDDLRLVFTRVGARLKQAYVQLHAHGESEIQLVPDPLDGVEEENPPIPLDAETVYPLGLRFSDDSIGDELDRVRFDIEEQTKTAVTFVLKLDGVATIRKTFSLDGVPYLLTATVDYENNEGEGRVLGMDQKEPAYTLNWGPNVDSDDKTKGLGQSLTWRRDGTNDMQATKGMEPEGDGTPFVKRIVDAEWLALRSAYFVVAMKPEFDHANGWATGDVDRFRFGMTVPRFEVAPGTADSRVFKIYVGPNQREYLHGAWDTLPSVLRFFKSVDFMNSFSKVLLRLLNWFYSVVPSYGVAIILLTLLVRGAMIPLTLKQMKSMKRMQLLAPEIEELKAKCGEDAQELNKKMMELYRERGVNPLGGCLPMVVQLPVFIALYRMLWSAYELRGAPFTLLKFGDYHWVADLSQPDRLLHMPWMTTVPVVGNYLEYLNILPLLGCVTMLLSVKLMPTSGPVQSSQQKMMTNFMPIFFGVICYGFASGLNLYILTSTTLGILQNKLVRISKDEKPPKKREPRKKQHFYTAAKARQRKLKKEKTKEGKKNKP